MGSKKFIAIIVSIPLVLVFSYVSLCSYGFNGLANYVIEGFMVTSAFAAFILWVHAVIPYGFRSVFGKMFVGIMLFLGLAASGLLLLYIYSLFPLLEYSMVFYIIGGVLFTISFLPLCASLLTFLCEQRVLLKKPIETANVYSSVIFVGGLALFWIYFIISTTRIILESLNVQAITVLAYTSYVVFDIIVLTLVIPLITASFKHGILQGAVRELLLAIVIYAIANILYNYVAVLNVEIWLIDVLPIIMTSVAYVFIAKPSLTLAKLGKISTI